MPLNYRSFFGFLPVASLEVFEYKKDLLPAGRRRKKQEKEEMAGQVVGQGLQGMLSGRKCKKVAEIYRSQAAREAKVGFSPLWPMAIYPGNSCVMMVSQRKRQRRWRDVRRLVGRIDSPAPLQSI